MTGLYKSIPEVLSDGNTLHEEWQWTSGDKSKDIKRNNNFIVNIVLENDKFDLNLLIKII